MKYAHIVFFIFILSFSPLGALAQAPRGDVYTVYNVEVTLTAGDHASNRSKAISQGISEGFMLLVNKLTSANVKYLHPQIFKKANYRKLMEKFSVVDEVTAPEYKLILNITYNREAVRKLLTSMNISFIETSNNKVLILPLLEIDGRTVLWEELNPWRKALEDKLEESTSLKYIVPTGDIAEISTITPSVLSSDATNILTPFINSYEADMAAIVRAIVVTTSWGQIIDVECKWVGNSKLDSVNITLPIGRGDGFEEVMTEAASKIFSAMDAAWRDKNIIAVDKEGMLFFRFKAKNPSEIERVQALMAEFSEVKSVRPRLLSLAETVLQVDFFGDNSQFLARLGDKGLFIKPSSYKTIFYLQLNDE